MEHDSKAESIEEQIQVQRIMAANGSNRLEIAKALDIAVITVSRRAKRYNIKKGKPKTDITPDEVNEGDASAIIPIQQRDRLKRLKRQVDTAITGETDPSKLKALADTVGKLHLAERVAWGIEDKPRATRAIVTLPAMVTVEMWQADQAPKIAGHTKQGDDDVDI